MGERGVDGLGTVVMRVHIASRRDERARKSRRLRRRLGRLVRVLGDVPVAIGRRAASTRAGASAKNVAERVVPSAVIHDRQMRAAAIGMVVGLVHVAYALINIVAGLIARSTWTLSVGFFFAALNVGKSYVASAAMTGDALKGGEGETALSLKRCRNVGIGLVLLNLAMSSTVVQLVVHGPGYTYPGALIYIYAAYALIQIIVAIVNQIRARRDARLAVKGVRMFNLSGALVSFFALQAAVLSHISWDNLPAMISRKAAEIAVGALVCFAMIAIGTLLARSAVARLAGRRDIRAHRGRQHRR